jgi:hypothetical protein
LTGIGVDQPSNGFMMKEYILEMNMNNRAPSVFNILFNLPEPPLFPKKPCSGEFCRLCPQKNMTPLRYDGDVAVFSVEDVDLMGEPCYYGFQV